MDPFASLFGVIAILTLAVSIVVSLVCFVLVLIQMFRRDQQNLGRVCILLFFAAGVGTIVVFVLGWIKASEWQIKKTMIVWTVCQVLQFVGLLLVMFAMIAYMRDRVRQEIDNARQAPERRIEIRNPVECYSARFGFSIDGR